MLVNKALMRRFKDSRTLKVYEDQSLYSQSGINATLFGATGFLGNTIAPTLGAIGSDLICPSKERFWFSDRVKSLRLAAPVGYVYVAHHTNFNDPHAIRRLVEKSNVVVNAIGPRKRYIRPERYQEANIDIPTRIAKQARLAGVKRLIHLSSVGVDPRSPSKDLSTKWEGEQRVLAEFPDATILRLATVIGPDDYFSRIFRIQACWFDRFIPVYSNLTAKRQPILAQDVANCVLSAIKQPETMGQTFELGGPHVYTLRELYDIMANALNKPMSFAKVDPKLALTVGKLVAYEHFNSEDIKKQTIDLIVNPAPGIKTIQDLFYQPASVMPTVEDDLAKWGEFDDVVKDQYQR